MTDAEYAAALAEAKAVAKRRADEQIQAGKPLGPMLIHTGRMLHPWERDTFLVSPLAVFKNRMVVVTADDVVTYDAAATVRWQGGEDARRARLSTVLQHNSNGNCREVVIQGE